MARHTSDLFAVHLNFPAAGEDPFIDVGNIVNGRGAGDNFKSGAWRHRGGKHLVEKYAVVLAGFVVFNVGAVFRVVGGRADHAEDFPGDIVGNHHSAVPVPHQGKSLGAQAAVQRQGQVVPGAESGVGADAGNKIIADQIRTAGILYRRGNGPGVVSDGLEHGLADEGIGAVNPLAVYALGKNFSIPVQYLSGGGQLAAVGVDMLVDRTDCPVAAVKEGFQYEKAKPRREHGGQDIDYNGSGSGGSQESSPFQRSEFFPPHVKCPGRCVRRPP